MGILKYALIVNQIEYFIKDNKQKYDCVFIINQRATKETLEKLKYFFPDIKEIQMTSSNEAKKNRIGFIVNDIKEEINNVCSPFSLLGMDTMFVNNPLTGSRNRLYDY